MLYHFSSKAPSAQEARGAKMAEPEQGQTCSHCTHGSLQPWLPAQPGSLSNTARWEGDTGPNSCWGRDCHFSQCYSLFSSKFSPTLGRARNSD